MERNRQYAVDQLGGECIACGYSKYRSALQIHHLDPALKSPTFTSFRRWSLDRLDKELESCILLCANCHSGIHYEKGENLQEKIMLKLSEDKRRIVLNSETGTFH